ncbi:unnamed protein product, partial [Ixodes pacificus]
RGLLRNFRGLVRNFCGLLRVFGAVGIALWDTGSKILSPRVLGAGSARHQVRVLQGPRKVLTGLSLPTADRLFLGRRCCSGGRCSYGGCVGARGGAALLRRNAGGRGNGGLAGLRFLRSNRG